MMTPLSHLLPPLPFLHLPQTYAPWPVWSDSSTAPIQFQPMPKKSAVKLWHRARDFDRGTHEPGKHGGAVGPTALQVLHALIFDFLNHRTGRLDPSYEAIARKAGVCVRAVATALARLRELGILNWVRRCAESWRDGRFKPRRLVTDGLRSYGVAQRAIMPDVRHRTSRYLNNRAENSHRPTRRRERQMQRFKSASQAQRFLSVHAMIYGHFRPRRHLMAAAGYRRVRAKAFRTWRQETCVHRAA